MFGYAAALITGALLGVMGTLALLLAGIAIFDQQLKTMRSISVRGIGYSLLTIFVIAVVCYYVNLRASIVVLLFFVCILTAAKLAGLLTGLIASMTAAGTLSLVFLSPAGSVAPTQPGDRLLVLLFLLAGAFVSRLVGGGLLL